jgi:hypothetical protein
VADNLILLGGRGAAAEAGADASHAQPISSPRGPQRVPPPAPAPDEGPSDAGITDDDVPF